MGSSHVRVGLWPVIYTVNLDLVQAFALHVRVGLCPGTPLILLIAAAGVVVNNEDVNLLRQLILRAATSTTTKINEIRHGSSFSAESPTEVRFVTAYFGPSGQFH